MGKFLNISTDTTLGGNSPSDSKVSSEKALKTYIDNHSSTYNAFTGADGTNAGTSGLVPAPAATDNTKFLKGDGTWSTVDSLPSQTSQSGKFLTTNGTTASWANVSNTTITFVDWSVT